MRGQVVVVVVVVVVIFVDVRSRVGSHVCRTFGVQTTQSLILVTLTPDGGYDGFAPKSLNLECFEFGVEAVSPYKSAVPRRNHATRKYVLRIHQYIFS